MPINVFWQDEAQAIICTQFVGHWNMKQFQEAWLQGHAMVREKSGVQVDFVFDLERSVLIPPNFVRQFRELPFDATQNLGLTVFIGTDEHLVLLIDHIVRSLSYNLRVAFAEDMAQALALILDDRTGNIALSA